MGDRAVVRFTDGNPECDVAIYLHWNGSSVREWLKAAAGGMRKGDAGYAAARFCGFCHDRIPGGLSLGILPGAIAGDMGDHGVFVVDVCTGRVTQFRDHSAGLARVGRSFTVRMGNF